MRGGSYFFHYDNKIEMSKIKWKHNVNNVEVLKIKSTLLVPQLQTDSFVSCLSIWSLSLLHPFNFSLRKCGLLFHVCVVFPSEQTKFLAQSLQSPNTDNYTVYIS